MTSDVHENRPLTEEELQDLVSSSDAGARNPPGSIGLFLAIVAVLWSVFQVTLASPLPNVLLPGSVVHNSQQIPLAFSLFLSLPA